MHFYHLINLVNEADRRAAPSLNVFLKDGLLHLKLCCSHTSWNVTYLSFPPNSDLSAVFYIFI